MRNLNPEFKNQAQLRPEGETRLRQGSAPRTRERLRHG